MPCSQMISMNCSPPWASAAARVAALPALKARIRNRLNRTIGSATRVSISTNATSRATPTPRMVSTTGFCQPIG